LRGPMHRGHGVTAIEILTTLAIVGALSVVAAPSFTNLRYDSERTAAVNGFLHGLFLARSESIKRGQVVTLCQSRDGASCAADAAWDEGWMIFVNSDRDNLPERDPSEDVILVDGGWRGGTITSNRAAYSFRPHRQSVVNGTIVFCDPRGSAHARAIIISHTGRPRVALRDASNRALRCSSP
jgi:type IV fimbrial biogenesis protein FimT